MNFSPSPQAAFDEALARLPASLREAPLRQRDALLHALAAEPSGTPQAAQALASSAPRVLACSGFVERSLAAHPGHVGALLHSAFVDAPGTQALAARVRAQLRHDDEENAKPSPPDEDFGLRLRRLREHEMVRIAWRDLAGLATLDETLAELSALADLCIRAALAQATRELEARHGRPRCAGSDQPAHMVVLGMGKLGGEELNFSSDVDLIFAYDHAGETDGKRSLDNQEFFTRLGRRLVALLDEQTAAGRVYRVDLRLRPFGDSGPLVLSFDALEHYYQAHGRDWERYAFIKARPVAGDPAAGQALLALLQPFVYRRYLDFGAIEALREMKALIVRQVERRGLEHNIKLGSGGIREVEFIAQVHQLVRGGREPALRSRRLREVLPVLAESGELAADEVNTLLEAYGALRRAENRLQMAEDRQVHELPQDAAERARLALAMDCPDWETCATHLAQQRAQVHALFRAVLGDDQPGREHASAPALDLRGLWLEPDEDDDSLRTLRAAGFEPPEQAVRILQELARGRQQGMASEIARGRLDALMPRLLEQVGGCDAPVQTLERIAGLVRRIITRSTYLALLLERPRALEHTVELMALSPWIAQWLTQYPVLLDELLDPRRLYALPTREELHAALAQIPRGDLEQFMNGLREQHHAAMLRIAAAECAGAADTAPIGAALAQLADCVLEVALAGASEDLAQRHGRLPPPHDQGLLVVGYGRLGSAEMGYGSDLDLVFLHDTPAQTESDGPRPLAAETLHARTVQRTVHLLSTATPAGRLYEVDLRLRPRGNAGPLATVLDAFADYHASEAWTWEHQALVRARVICGDAVLAERFAAVRRQTLQRHRNPAELRAAVAQMRNRVRENKAMAEGFHIKHGSGGMLDIEFLAQYLVLAHAHDHGELTEPRDVGGILACAARADVIALGEADELAEIYSRLLAAERRCKLADQAPALADDGFEAERERVQRAWRQHLDPD